MKRGLFIFLALLLIANVFIVNAEDPALSGNVDSDFEQIQNLTNNIPNLN